MAKSKKQIELEEAYLLKLESVKKFLMIVIGYGLLINYPLFILLGLPFNLFTFPAWGITYYLIKDEFVEWIRRLIVKR